MTAVGSQLRKNVGVCRRKKIKLGDCGFIYLSFNNIHEKVSSFRLAESSSAIFKKYSAKKMKFSAYVSLTLVFAITTL